MKTSIVMQCMCLKKHDDVTFTNDSNNNIPRVLGVDPQPLYGKAHRNTKAMSVKLMRKRSSLRLRIIYAATSAETYYVIMVPHNGIDIFM